MTSPDIERLLWQGASICLRYPQRADLVLVKDILPSFVDYALERDDLEAHYVETFDFVNRHSLYLTWYSDGDTRRRGSSLVALKRAFTESGLILTDTELPDFLPAVLEYSARTGDPRFLEEHRPAMVQLHGALVRAGTIYALPVAAVLATVAVTARTTAEQPPIEMVGLR